MAGPDAAFAAKLAHRTRHNEVLMLYFLAAMLGLVVVFSAAHLLRRSRDGEAASSSPLVRLSRCFRRFALRSCRGVPTLGHALLVGLYVMANCLVFFVHLDGGGDMPRLSNVGSRTAWLRLSLGNLVVVVVLGLKVTPLALLTGRSYDRLNVLHRVAGATTVSLVILHASCYTAYFVGTGRGQRLLRSSDICGMVAGLSMLGLAAAGFFLRRRFYEVFYYLHISLWLLALVMTALHQPDLDRHAVVVLVAVVGGVWALDRLLRLVRFAIGAVGNSARLTTLPDQSTRVILAKPPLGASSGMHCFLWLPGMRPGQSHPFTIAGLNPPELIVAPAGGFARVLHGYADANAGNSVLAAVEGPYGAGPSPAAYSSVVFIAGGSGITFTLGSALDMLRTDQNQRVLFVWIVKTTASFDSLRHRLATLRDDPRVTLRLFVTRPPPTPATPATPASIHEPVELLTLSLPTTHSSADSDQDLDPEKAWSGPTLRSDKWQPPSDVHVQTTRVLTNRPSNVNGIAIAYERPNVASLIRAAIDDTPPDRRALVLGCGPGPLMTVVRNTTASCIRGDGPAVDLHIENFAW
ncbi:hypothetical protein XA68_15497 [Ophiocordyceps unilateralis]|uniref:FAD-binding FR-type domain-containing protein n=1 Tax=Ophiocordyceps unilateralis TaxID=268505 RepID=A0A2A9P6G7_OPHUN|nr:hypothetical protein XA68_15497 [Ophiocordyceps unilateralis]